MATVKKPETDDLYDLGDVPKTENTSAAVIDKAGIHHDLKVNIAIVSGNYKDEARKGTKWHGFEVTLTNPDELECKEVYFAPPASVEDISDKVEIKHYELVGGKFVETRKKTKSEILKCLNNEFLAFLIDLGEALGFSYDVVKEHLYKNAKGFKVLAQAFIDKFKPSDTTRISAKLLYDNNDKAQTSYLKMHGTFTVYYPFGNDFFDICKEDRPTLLKISNWEAKNKLVKTYVNAANAPAAGAPTVSKKSEDTYKAVIADDDVF